MSFILTSLAGLSTLIGSLFIFIKSKNIDKILNISLSFTIGIMITVSLFDLIPGCIHLFNGNLFIKILHLLISINIGIIISIYLDKKIDNSNNLYRVGIISLIAIIIHNIPEGIVTYLVTDYDLKLGIRLALSIALHNIPEGISISLPIYYATGDRSKALLYTFISGISEIFGAIITAVFLKKYINENIISILFGIISGIMLYISIFELYKEVKQKSRGVTLLSILIGSLTMIISILLIK